MPHRTERKYCFACLSSWRSYIHKYKRLWHLSGWQRGITYRRIWRIYYGISKLSGKKRLWTVERWKCVHGAGEDYFFPGGSRRKFRRRDRSSGAGLCGFGYTYTETGTELCIRGMGSGNPGIRSGKGEHCVSCDFWICTYIRGSTGGESDRNEYAAAEHYCKRAGCYS